MTASRLQRQLGAFGAVVLASFLLGNGCGALKGVRIDAPAPAAIFTADPIDANGRLGRNLDLSTATVEVNGVDLIAALALVPPFTGQGGVVLIGGDSVTVSDFSLEAPAEGPRTFAFTLTGLSDTTHTLTVSAFDPGPSLTKLATLGFDLVDFFVLQASDTVSAGLPLGPLVSSTEGTLVNVAVGQAIVSPPIATTAGDTVESGLPALAAELAD